MKLNRVSKVTWIARAAVVATAAFLSVNAVRAAEFFNDSVIAGTSSIHGDEVADAAQPVNQASTTVRVSVPIDLGGYQFSHASMSPDVAAIQQPTVGGSIAEIMAVPVPEPATGVAVLGVLGFLGYRERRRAKALWTDRVVPALANLASLLCSGLGALVRKIRPSVSAK